MNFRPPRFARRALKSMGMLHPSVSSFETALVNWLDGTIHEGNSLLSGALLDKAVDPSMVAASMDKELLIAYLHVLTALSRRYYADSVYYKKGMDELRREAYRWFFDDDDDSSAAANAFYERVNARFAAYEKAGGVQDTLALTRQFVSILLGPTELKMSETVTLSTAFTRFANATRELLPQFRSFYPEPRRAKDYYALLQVHPAAELPIIRAAYRTIMSEMKMHPDLGGSTEHASEINEAYEVLSDPDKRRDYDRRRE